MQTLLSRLRGIHRSVSAYAETIRAIC